MRAYQKTITAYKIEELDEKAQQYALDKWNENNFMDGLVLDYFTQILEILGFSDVKIMYSGFYSQGDGACFTGSYAYSAGWRKALRNYCSSPEWMAIGQALQDVQSKYLYGIIASSAHMGNYYYENSVIIDVEHDRHDVLPEAAQYAMCDIFRDAMRLIYRSLEREYEHQTSMEAFIESCEANGYEFLESGVML